MCLNPRLQNNLKFPSRRKVPDIQDCGSSLVFVSIEQAGVCSYKPWKQPHLDMHFRQGWAKEGRGGLSASKLVLEKLKKEAENNCPVQRNGDFGKASKLASLLTPKPGMTQGT